MKLIVFDLDGTLVEFNIPVNEVKAALRIEGPILEEIIRRRDGWECLKILERYEVESAQKSTLYPGVREFFKFLERNGIFTALYTRNSIKSVRINLKKHDLRFDFVFTREDDIKPSPHPVTYAMDEIGASKNEAVFIGDYYFDYLAAKNAEIEFWLFESNKAMDALRRFRFDPDLRFRSYLTLKEHLEMRLNGY